MINELIKACCDSHSGPFLDMLTLETALVRDPYAGWCERSGGVSPPPTRCFYRFFTCNILVG